MMTSGLTIRIVFKDKTALRILRLRIKTMPIAPKTPMAVDINAESNATITVFSTMTIRRVSLNTAA